jgi:hypothetical protein
MKELLLKYNKFANIFSTKLWNVIFTIGSIIFAIKFIVVFSTKSQLDFTSIILYSITTCIIFLMGIVGIWEINNKDNN